jgi:toxin YoeB
MKRIVFEGKGFEEYNDWVTEDKKIYKKLLKLIYETAKTPFEGSGKPEKLKYDYQGYWSRRINDEHRLVYKVTDEEIIIISCKYHY